MEKLKIGYDTLREVNPRIIHSSTSGKHPYNVGISRITTHSLKATDQQDHSRTELATI
jgi:hypothetical protein